MTDARTLLVFRQSGRAEHERDSHSRFCYFSIAIQGIPVVVILVWLDLQLTQRDLSHAKRLPLQREKRSLALDGDTENRIHLGKCARIL